MRTRLVVVCDVGPAIGVGHVMRCLALAEEFAARGFDVVFVADVRDVPFAERELGRRRFTVLPQPPDVAGILDLLDGLEPGAVLIDSYRLPAELYAAATTRFRTVAIVDGDPAGRSAHVYVDQNLGAEDDEWPLPEGALRLAGLDYALMRSEILAHRPSTADDHVDHEPPRVFAVFGGTDAAGAGPVLTDALVATGRPFDLTVVTPRRWPPPPCLPDQRIAQIEPTGRLPELVGQADLVVSAAGSSSWELLCLRAACALVAVADNQLVSYERVQATGAVAGLGLLDETRLRPARAVHTLSELLSEPSARRQLRERAGTLVDGRGRVRVVDAVLS